MRYAFRGIHTLQLWYMCGPQTPDSGSMCVCRTRSATPPPPLSTDPSGASKPASAAGAGPEAGKPSALQPGERGGSGATKNTSVPPADPIALIDSLIAFLENGGGEGGENGDEMVVGGNAGSKGMSAPGIKQEGSQGPQGPSGTGGRSSHVDLPSEIFSCLPPPFPVNLLPSISAPGGVPQSPPTPAPLPPTVSRCTAVCNADGARPAVLPPNPIEDRPHPSATGERRGYQK